MIKKPIAAFGRAAGPAAVAAIVDSASGNPSEGFMHLGQQGDAGAGLGRVMSTLGHKMTGQSSPNDVTGGQLYDAFMHHSPMGDTLTGAYNWATKPKQSFTNLGVSLNHAFDNAVGGIGEFLANKGDSMAGVSPVAQAEQQANTAVVPGGRTMTADQLNSQYEKLGVGGANPVHPAASPPAAVAPRSGDTPGVMSPGIGQASPLNADLGRVGYADQALDHAVMEAAGAGNFESAASLGHALAMMRNSAGGIQAQMVGANASQMHAAAAMFGAQNPMGNLRDPVNAAAADAQLGGTGAVPGVAAADGYGGIPGGPALSHFLERRHPEFMPFTPDKEWTVDALRDRFNVTKSRFREGDSQLADTQDLVRRLLQSKFGEDELNSAAEPGWFGSGSEGAGRNKQFYRDIQIR